MKLLTSKDKALEIIENAYTKPLEGITLVKLLEFVFFLTSHRVTVTDFQAAAHLAAKSFRIDKQVNSLDGDVLAKIIADIIEKDIH